MGKGRIGTVLVLLLGGWLGTSCVVYTQEPASGAEREPAHAHAGGRHRPAPPPRPGPPPPAGSQGSSQPAPRPPDPDDPVGPGELPIDIGSQPTLPQTPFEEPPEYQGRLDQLPPGAAIGRPPGFRPGAPPAYWIWQTPRGGWLLRTTTAGETHLFRGRIAGAPGEIVNVHPQRTEFRDRIRRTRSGWVFSFTTAGHADGYTFMTRQGDCVRFDLELDGGPKPKKVFVGRAEHRAPVAALRGVRGSPDAVGDRAQPPTRIVYLRVGSEPGLGALTLRLGHLPRRPDVHAPAYRAERPHRRGRELPHAGSERCS